MAEFLAIPPNRILGYRYQPGRWPVIVFIHGGMSCQETWYCQWPVLFSQGHAMLSWDLAGHGHSTPASAHRPADHAQDLWFLLTHLGITSPVVLVCHSYGVPVGIEFARQHPPHSLLGIAGGVCQLTPWWEPPLIMVLERIGRLGLFQQLPREKAVYQAMRGFWGYDGSEGLASIQAPVILVGGERDTVFPPAWVHQQSALFPFGTGQVFPGVGHQVMIQAAEPVNKLISQLCLLSCN